MFQSALRSEVPMLVYVLVFFSALVLSLIATRSVRGWATRFGLLDFPDSERRWHDRPVPRVGGIGIYLAMVPVLALTLVLQPHLYDREPSVLLLLLGALTAVFLLGLWDDVRRVRASTKIAIEVAIAVVIFMAGVGIREIGLPGGLVVLPTWLALAITVLWIVGITNAFNLIDGSDGVAAGAAIFAAASLAAVSFISGQHLGVVIALALAGGTLGFLVFNFPPASIFLGDCGSLLVGFVLATLGLVTTQRAPTLLAVAIPVVSLGLPILDTLLAIVRRFLRGEPLFLADRGHIHHRLRDLGHSPRRVAFVLYGACAAFSMLSLLLVQPAGGVTAGLFLIAGAILWFAVQRLHIPELLEVQRIVDRGLRQRTAIAKNVRIREAAIRLRRTGTPAELVSALTHALDATDFGRAELRVERSEGECLLREGLAQVSDRDVVWQWTHAVGPEPSCQMRVPLVLSGAERGALTLWFRPGVRHLLIDLRLITHDLAPELHRALARCKAGASAAEPEAAPARDLALRVTG